MTSKVTLRQAMMPETPSENLLETAQRRASVLSDLRRASPQDPRVQAVFEADPIVAEDLVSGNLITRAMLDARLDLLDVVLTLIDAPVLSRGMRARTALALKGAFPVLSDEAQIEWTLSGLRMEEAKVFLDERSADELIALGAQIATLHTKKDLWTAARGFTVATHVGGGRARGTVAPADLLEMRELDA